MQEAVTEFVVLADLVFCNAKSDAPKWKVKCESNAWFVITGYQYSFLHPILQVSVSSFVHEMATLQPPRPHLITDDGLE